MSQPMLAILSGELLTGASIPFAAAFALAVLFTVLSVLGLGHSSEAGEADVDADLEHDVEWGTDSVADGDGGFDQDLEVDQGIEAAADHDAGDLGQELDAPADHAVLGEAGAALTLHGVLSFFGVGRVPLSLLLMSFCYAFGVTGWVVNALAARPGEARNSLFSASLACATVAGLAAMRLVSSVVVRVMPTRNVSGFSRRRLVGLRGVVGLPVEEGVGRAEVTDPEGTRHQVRCRTVPGGKPLPKGARVVLVKYIPEDDVYLVAADRQR